MSWVRTNFKPSAFAFFGWIVLAPDSRVGAIETKIPVVHFIRSVVVIRRHGAAVFQLRFQ